MARKSSDKATRQELPEIVLGPDRGKGTHKPVAEPKPNTRMDRSAHRDGETQPSVFREIILFASKLGLVAAVIMAVLYVHQNELLKRPKETSEPQNQLQVSEDDIVAEEDRQIPEAEVIENSSETPDLEEILSPREVFSLARSSVYVIEVERGDGFSHGTGVSCIDPRILITNYHVIEGAKNLKVRDLDDGEFAIEGVLALDKEADLAALRISEPLETNFLDLDQGPVQAGDEVVVVGNPSGLEGSVSNGVVAAVRRISGVSVIQMTAPISPGSSGSPVLNSRGKVVGIAHSIITRKHSQSLNLAAHRDSVAGLIQMCFMDKETGEPSMMLRKPMPLQEIPSPDLPSEKFVESTPPKPQVFKKSENQMRYAWALANRGRLGEAKKVIGGMEEAGVPGASSFRLLCVAYVDRDYEAAISNAQQFLKQRVHSSIVWCALGESYIKHGQHRSGIPCLKEAIRIDWEYSRPWQLISIVLFPLPKWKSAAIYAGKVASGLDPDFKAFLKDMGMWLPKLVEADREKWVSLYSTYFWTELEPDNVDHWIDHCLSVKKWEGLSRAKKRLKAGLSATGESPDLLDFEVNLN